jgi:hypothetical protein
VLLADSPRLFVPSQDRQTPSCSGKNLLASKSVSTAAVALLGNGELDTLALGKGDPGLLLADDENVALTGGELVVNGVLDVDDVEATVVTLTVGDDTNTTHVTTTSGHGDHTGVEADEVLDLAWIMYQYKLKLSSHLLVQHTGGEVDLDGVVDLDGGVGVTDPTQSLSIQIAKHWSNV